MNCPKCRQKMKVVDSRAFSGMVSRYRVCSCGYKCFTKETIDLSENASTEHYYCQKIKRYERGQI